MTEQPVDGVGVDLNRYTYTVQAGDNPWKIAQAKGIDLDDLLALNHLTPTTPIYQDQELVLRPGPAIYTVKNGDTLWGIAKMARTTVDRLRELNNISGDTIHIGCVLDVTPDTKETA